MDILSVVLLFLPFILILWLANLADRRRQEGDLQSGRVLAWLGYGLLVAIYGMLVLLGLLTSGIALLQAGPLGTQLGDLNAAAGLGEVSWGRLGLALWLPSILGIVLLLPPVRRLAARVIPLDAASPVHAVGLSYSALVLLNLLVTLGMGLDNLADMLQAGQAAGVSYNMPGLLWAQDVTLLAMALVGVGWLSRRNFRAALRRLALVLPTWRQAGIGLGVGLVLVPLILALERLASLAGLGVSPDVERLTEVMIGPLTTSLLGVLTLGLAAALGEETVFRGALQPAFGLLFTSLLFALLHSNYGITLSTALVFAVGIVLGLLRRRYNTSTAMLAHAIYNITLGLAAYLGFLKDL